MKPEKFETFAKGTSIHYGGIDNLTFDGVAYEYVYLKDQNGNEEKFHIDLFNKYGRLQN